MAHDCIVIGGGPVGGFVALGLAERGFNPMIIEEHKEIGKPVQCAGIVSPRVFDVLGFKAGVIREMRKANFFSPSGRSISVEGKGPKAMVIDRSRFDREIIERAVRAGADLVLDAKVTDLKKEGGSVRVDYTKDGETYSETSNLVAGCDGVRSIVARTFGLPRPREVLPAFGAEGVSSRSDSDAVDIYTGNDIAPGFFMWAIPTGDETRLGLATAKGSARKHYASAMETVFIKERVGDFQPVQHIAGTIPMGVSKKTYADNAIIVGDSAAQVKPTSGGGIFPGLRCAAYAAEVLSGAIDKGDFSASRLKGYQKLWEGDVGKELKKGYRLRKTFMFLSDKQIEKVFEVLDDEKVREIISEHGDIDFPSRLTKEMLKRVPKLMDLAGPFIKASL